MQKNIFLHSMELSTKHVTFECLHTSANIANQTSSPLITVDECNNYIKYPAVAHFGLADARSKCISAKT